MSPYSSFEFFERRAADDLFECLARCDRLLTGKELADIVAISSKTLYSYVTRGMHSVIQDQVQT
jgi:hypothetical protein